MIDSVRPADGAGLEAGRPPDLREATQEFESLFIAQVLQAMRRTVPGTGLMGHGSGQQVFREMLDQEMARRIAHSGGFGIGEILYRQLCSADAGAAAATGTEGAAPGSDARLRASGSSRGNDHENR